MKLKEEKTSIIIEIVILIFIVIISIFLQIGDAKIKNYNDKINLVEMRHSQYLELGTYHSQKVSYYELSELLSQLGARLGKKLVIREDTIAEPENVGEEYKELMNNYKTNKIDAQTFLDEIGNLHRKQTEYYKSRVKQMQDTRIEMYKNPPKLFWLNIFLFQRICFIAQLIGSLLAIILFVRLFMQISGRVKS